METIIEHPNKRRKSNPFTSSELEYARAKNSDRNRIILINVVLTEMPRNGRVEILAEINETKIMIPLFIFIFVTQKFGILYGMLILIYLNVK